MSIIIAILMFGLVIIVHEFGHFFAAKKVGIKVEEFSIGMGPRLFSFEKGETLFSLKLFPIGGSCRMLGEDKSEGESDPRAFNNKKVSERIIVIVAGAFMNFVLALLITMGVNLVWEHSLPVVNTIMPGYPAAEAGLQPGDKIIRANGKRIHVHDEFNFVMMQNGGNPLEITIDRNGEKLEKVIVPQLEVYENGYERYILGFYVESKLGIFSKKDIVEVDVDSIDETLVYTKGGFFESIENAFFQNLFYIKATAQGFKMLFTGNLTMDDMAGPIGVVSLVGETYTVARKESISLAIEQVLIFTALLSANLAVVNMMPLPAIDGGRLVFLIIEGIRRKPIRQEIEGMIHFVGFVLIMLFAVFVAYNDIIRLL